MTQSWQPGPYQRRPVDISAYAPPKRSGGGWWLLLLLGGVLLVLVLAALFIRPPLPGPASAPTPTAAPTEAAGSGSPFTMPGAPSSRGRWEIISHEWSGAGLTVRVRVSSDAGRVNYGFVAFSNASTEIYLPEAGAPPPEIGSGSLQVGQTIEGHLFIPMPRGDATLVLTTESGRQMSALAIAG